VDGVLPRLPFEAAGRFKPQTGESSLRILITGGAGFIGSHFVDHFLKNTDVEIVVLDKLTYASTWDRLRDIGAYQNKRVTCLSTDFTNPVPVGVVSELGKIDYLLHMGAETHVDRSIEDPEVFVRANVIGTLNMLQLARNLDLKMFYYFSTDEVFGPAPEGVAYKEDDAHSPGNPYAASKSGGEMLCQSFANTYKIPLVITRTMNVFGERQHPEKFIPMLIRRINAGQKVTIHANKDKTKAGSRFYIHARNVAAAFSFIVNKGELGKSYHIVGEKEIDNLIMAQTIAKILGKPLHYDLVDFHSSRPGHDLRYALDGSRLANMGWKLPRSFEQSLEKTVHWFMDNRLWLSENETKEAA